MQYADIRKLTAGQTVFLDSGFTCRNPGPTMLYNNPRNKTLFFVCSEGFHNLEGQCDDGIHCVGVYTEENYYTQLDS